MALNADASNQAPFPSLFLDADLHPRDTPHPGGSGGEPFPQPETDGQSDPKNKNASTHPGAKSKRRGEGAKERNALVTESRLGPHDKWAGEQDLTSQNPIPR